MSTLQTARVSARAGVTASELPRLHRAGQWVGRAFWAVLDQGLFATSNFILGILLARWLPPEQFGSFAVAQSVFLLGGTLHTGLFSEPMLVFGSAKHATRFPVYLDILLRAHWRASASGGLLLLLAALVLRGLGSFALAGAFLGAAIASPSILFSWLVRRACLARLRPRWAATGGGLYLLFVLAGSYALWLLDLLSPLSAFVLLGAAGLVSGAWSLRQLQHGLASQNGDTLTRDEVLRDHWRYGRWAVASSGLSWIPGNLYYVLLPVFAGLEATGALKALSTLVLPILHFNAAMSTLLLPALSSAARGRYHFTRLVVASLAALVGSSLLYGALVTVFRVPIIDWVYQGAYRDSEALMPIVALLPVTAAFIAVLGSALRALERPQYVFWTYVASTAATVTVGIWCLAVWGSLGAAVGLFLSSAITAAMCGGFLIRYGLTNARRVSEEPSLNPDSGVVSL